MSIKQTYPQRFGKYILLTPLAKGGMGELYLAYSGHAELKKLCVIKTLLRQLADEEFLNRFFDEAKVVVKLSHGNIVPVFEAGQVDGQYFVAMEYIEGKDLRDLWHRLDESGRACPLDVALFICREICRGLFYVHTFEELNLVHRDISPPNVLLSYSGEVRLTDFGVATSTIKLQKTAPGILLGKLSYMSPEQARNEAVDPRADIYSAGIILWELLTGQRLFPPGSSLLERFQRATKPTVPPPSKFKPDLPPALDLITLRALAADPAGRYADAECFRRDLALQLAQLNPAADSSSVQALLKDLCGEQIAEERQQRRDLLEAMSGEIQQLMSGESERGELGRAHTKPLPRGQVLFSGEQDTNRAGLPSPGAEDEEDEEDEAEETADGVPRLRAGTILGDRYRVMDLIGEGGMGTVYEATHVDIDKKVAVKVLHPVYSRMPDVVSRFRQEARAASRIGHPNIVEVYDSGTTGDGCLYFVMEQLSGIDLAEVLDREHRLAVPRAIRIATQICEAVAAAHEAGIVHRDLKPENIFLTIREGVFDFVKVLDFGIAKTSSLEESRAERLTHPGMAMGTPEYMAPEQAAGKPNDHRVDIYAAGALLYEMVVGEPPHTGDNIMEVLNLKATQPVVPPRQRRPEVPEELEQLILWALKNEPVDRPQTMSQLCYELNKITRGRAGAVASLLGLPNISGPPVGPALRSTTAQVTAYDPAVETAQTDRSTRWRWILSGAGLLAALVALGLSLWQQETPAPAAANVLALPDGRPGMLARSIAHPDAAAPADLVSGLAAAAEAEAEDRGDEGSGEDAGEPKVRPRVPARPGAQVYLAVGQRHLLSGQFSAARVSFEAASRSPKLRGQALLGLAEVEFQLGNYGQAQAQAQQALSHGAGLRAKLVLANVSFKLREFQIAVRLYQAVLAQDSGNKEAQRNLAAAQHRLNQ